MDAILRNENERLAWNCIATFKLSSRVYGMTGLIASITGGATDEGDTVSLLSVNPGRAAVFKTSQGFG
jgi:hypothetical protein